MIRSARLSTVLTVTLLSAGAILLANALGMLHQGEEIYWFGKLVIWSASAALLASVVAAASVFFSERTTRWATLVALLLTVPIGVVTMAPAVWCAFLPCSDSMSIPAPLNLQGLLLFLPQIATLLLLKRRQS